MAKAKAKTVEATQVNEGETAMSKALRDAFTEIGQSFQATPASARVLDETLTFVGKRNDVVKAVASHGPENLFRVLSELAVADTITAMNAIRAIMRQLTSDVHFRWRNVHMQQMRAARANGGGVEGYELPVSEIMERYSSYPALPDDACTPAEQSEIVQDLHALLNTAFQVCDRARMYWMDDYQVQELPYFTYQDENNDYISLYSFDEALAYLDRRQEDRQTQRKQRTVDAVKAIADLKLVA